MAKVTLYILPGAQVAQGSASGVYAAPYLSSDNGDGFGSGVRRSGQWDRPHALPVHRQDRRFNTRHHHSVLCSAQQISRSAGGSIDTYNHISFYMDAQPIRCGEWKRSGVCRGERRRPGSERNPIREHHSDLPFNTVIFTSDNYAFEFDNIGLQQRERGCSRRRLHHRHARGGRGRTRGLGATPDHGQTRHPRRRGLSQCQ
jgi:hypothetical protein